MTRDQVSLIYRMFAAGCTQSQVEAVLCFELTAQPPELNLWFDHTAGERCPVEPSARVNVRLHHQYAADAHIRDDASVCYLARTVLWERVKEWRYA